MDKQQAIERVKVYIEQKGYLDYPIESLVAERFEIGWTVFGLNGELSDINNIRMGQKVFLIGDNGQIEESSSSIPPGQAEKAFVDKLKAQ